MTLVVDASVACKWFFPEAGSDKAEALLGGPDDLVAPDLLVSELGNAAWLKVGRGEATLDAALVSIRGIDRFVVEFVAASTVIEEAVRLAHAIDHAVYDCVYLALASARGTRLVTADRRMLSKLARRPERRLVLLLDDVP